MVSLKRNPDSNHNPAHRLCVFKSSQVTKCSTHKRHSDICVMNREQGADEWPSINLEFGRGIEVMTSRCCFAQIRQLLMHRKSININSIINVVDEEYDSRGLLSHSPHHKWQRTTQYPQRISLSIRRILLHTAIQFSCKQLINQGKAITQSVCPSKCMCSYQMTFTHSSVFPPHTSQTEHSPQCRGLQTFCHWCEKANIGIPETSRYLYPSFTLSNPAPRFAISTGGFQYIDQYKETTLRLVTKSGHPPVQLQLYY